MKIDIISVFPEMFAGFLRSSILARAQRMGKAEIRTVDLRDFARDVRRTVDDKPYGGGPGMLMKPEVWFDAVEAIRTPEARVIITAPTGRRYSQAMARDFATASHLIFMCGHYEGFDERVMQLATDSISIGDFVLTGGELAAAVMADSIVRLLPGVLGGGAAATEQESFTTNLLEAPQFTRPSIYRGMKVPEELTCGDHARAETWRRRQAYDLTARNRPDLLAQGGTFTPLTAEQPISKKQNKKGNKK